MSIIYLKNIILLLYTLNFLVILLGITVKDRIVLGELSNFCSVGGGRFGLPQ